MLVKAMQGMQCPREGKPREYITDSQEVEVPDTVYYLKLVADGSLISGDAVGAQVIVPKKGGKE
jgi:hypothetical protein